MTPISPDCEVAKHDACSGDAWDHQADQLTPCTCRCHLLPTVPLAYVGPPLTLPAGTTYLDAVRQALAGVQPVPPTVDLEPLQRWAQEALPLIAQRMRELTAAVQPLVDAMADLEQQRRRRAVPFWTEQPNRSRRRR